MDCIARAFLKACMGGRIDCYERHALGIQM